MKLREIIIPSLIQENYFHIGGKKIRYFSEKDPSGLPWKELNIDVVIESTGFFTRREDAEKHILAGAKTVVISGPTKSIDTPTVVHGVNTAEGKVSIFSCASCTTNSISPLIEILGRRIGIKKAILNTTHAYTASQSLVDGPSKKEPRMGRAAGMNLAPAATGAPRSRISAAPTRGPTVVPRELNAWVRVSRLEDVCSGPRMAT